MCVPTREQQLSVEQGLRLQVRALAWVCLLACLARACVRMCVCVFFFYIVYKDSGGAEKFRETIYEVPVQLRIACAPFRFQSGTFLAKSPPPPTARARVGSLYKARVVFRSKKLRVQSFAETIETSRLLAFLSRSAPSCSCDCTFIGILPSVPCACVDYSAALSRVVGLFSAGAARAVAWRGLACGSVDVFCLFPRRLFSANHCRG